VAGYVVEEAEEEVGPVDAEFTVGFVGGLERVAVVDGLFEVAGCSTGIAGLYVQVIQVVKLAEYLKGAVAVFDLLVLCRGGRGFFKLRF